MTSSKTADVAKQATAEMDATIQLLEKATRLATDMRRELMAAQSMRELERVVQKAWKRDPVAYGSMMAAQVLAIQETEFDASLLFALIYALERLPMIAGWLEEREELVASVRDTQDLQRLIALMAAPKGVAN